MDRTVLRNNRRRFLQGSLALAGLSLLAGCGALPTQVSRAAKVPRIGWLGGGAGITASDAAFQDGLAELGYVEGQTIVLERRVAGGSEERLRDLAAELVGLNVDVLVTNNFIGAAAAKDRSNTIPIIVLAGGDPVQAGLAASFARPGGQVTGVTAISHALSGKRLALL